jgi:3,4-dihydroxy-2-butanone 4-phosphate synthase
MTLLETWDAPRGGSVDGTWISEDCVKALLAGDPMILQVGSGQPGYLVAAGDRVSTSTMAFLIHHTDGFVCVATDDSVLDRLALPPMVHENDSIDRLDYSVSVDAVKGTGTGISAHDRAITVRALADPSTHHDDLARPGHVLPIRSSGRWGADVHATAVSIMRRLALPPVAALAPMLDERGEIVSADQLMVFSNEYGVPIAMLPGNQPGGTSERRTGRSTPRH